MEGNDVQSQPTPNSAKLSRAEENPVLQLPAGPYATTVDTAIDDAVTDAPCENETSFASVSHSKLSGNDSFYEPKSDNVCGYRFIDMSILDTIISSLICPVCCNNTVQLAENLNKRFGSASALEISCICGYKKLFYTSPKCTIKGTKNAGFEINKRFVYAMRSCGQGYAGMERFATLINMPKPMNKNNYNRLAIALKDACKEVAIETMKEAAKHIHKKKSLPDNAIADVAVSCDGSWQRQGFSSLNGFVSAISMDTGKILDIESMTRYCRSCQMQQTASKSDPDGYAKWKESHNCIINYKGSAPGMEIDGTKRIFQRSIAHNSMRYTELFGDGDSKTFPAIKDTYVNNDADSVKVVKKECVQAMYRNV